MALPRIDPTGERIVPAFIGMLRGEDRHAAHALGYCWTFHRGTMSAALKASVPALLIASKSKDGTLRQEALDALKDIDPTALR